MCDLDRLATRWLVSSAGEFGYFDVSLENRSKDHIATASIFQSPNYRCKLCYGLWVDIIMILYRLLCCRVKMHATYINPPTQTRLYCARNMHAPTHPNIRKLCTLHTCTHLSKHAHNMFLFIYALHTCTHILRMLHTCTTHLNIRMLWTKHTCKHLHNTRILCTIHACTNPPLHSDVVHDTYMHQPTQTRVYCARYIHARTHPNICTLCTLHTCTHLSNTYTGCIKRLSYYLCSFATVGLLLLYLG